MDKLLGIWLYVYLSIYLDVVVNMYVSVLKNIYTYSFQLWNYEFIYHSLYNY